MLRPHKPHRPPEAVRAGLHGRCQGGLRGLRWVGPIRLADPRPQVAHHVRQARPPAELVERGRDGPRAAGGASPLIRASGATKLERRQVPSRVGPCKVFASK